MTIITEGFSVIPGDVESVKAAMDHLKHGGSYTVYFNGEQVYGPVMAASPADGIVVTERPIEQMDQRTTIAMPIHLDGITLWFNYGQVIVKVLD